MNGLQRWIRAPQTHLLRRVLYQVHLWCGIGLGLYVLMISVTGSAIVFKPQLTRWVIPDTVPSVEGQRLQGEALQAELAVRYADYEVVSFFEAPAPAAAVRVVLRRDGEQSQRYFDPYAGTDLGSTFPFTARLLQWTADLHADLFLGHTGRKVNGVGGALFLGMALTGLVIWWRGNRRWYHGFIMRFSSTRGFAWQLHSFIGFWSLLLLFAWGVTAVYFAFPAPFEWLIDYVSDDPTGRRRSDGFLRFLLDLHFGRFAGFWTGMAWVILGLLPAVMFLTGFWVWWKRVATRARGLDRDSLRPPAAGKVG